MPIKRVTIATRWETVPIESGHGSEFTLPLDYVGKTVECRPLIPEDEIDAISVARRIVKRSSRRGRIYLPIGWAGRKISVELLPE